jgi:cytochrome c5
MSEIHVEEHSTPIKTPKQLIILLVLAFAVPITLIVMLSQLVTGSIEAGKASPGMSDEAIAKRLQPVGEVVVADVSAPRVEKSGKEVVEAVCAACHATGALNAPKIGDKTAWTKLIKQGLGIITKDAINGIRQMPARGGNPDLTDIEVERAVVYMANQAGANWVEPVSKTTPAAARSGEQIVQAQCIKCHGTGEGGSPRIGDREAWIPRVKRGVDAVVQSAIKGHGAMQARGGMADLTDAELRSAILYMFSAGGAPAPQPAAKAAPAPGVAAQADAGKGKAVYDASCAACHAAGVAGAPKAGDKAAWAPRVKSGTDALYASALKGKNAMPPKGGNLALADADVKAAVDYLVGLAK